MNAPHIALDAGLAREVETGAFAGARWWLSDALLLGQRNLRRMVRSPDLAFYALIQPVMFILLFVYVFGGAIQVPGMSYRQFLLPGIFVQMVIFGSVAATALGIAQDMQRGVMDRFRSLPMTSSSVLLGRQVSEVARNLISVAVMIAVGLLVGFRFHGSLAQTLAGFGLLLLFGFAFSWVAAVIGLASKSVEAAQSAGLMWLFPVTFLSSAFVPSATMPTGLRLIAEHSPITYVVNTLRAWFGGGAAGADAWLALAWSIGITAVFMPMAIARFRRRDG